METNIKLMKASLPTSVNGQMTRCY